MNREQSIGTNTCDLEGVLIRVALRVVAEGDFEDNVVPMRLSSALKPLCRVRKGRAKYPGPST